MTRSRRRPDSTPHIRNLHEVIHLRPLGTGWHGTRDVDGDTTLGTMSTKRTESSILGRRLFSAVAGWLTTTLTSRATQLGLQVHALQSELTEYVALEDTRATHDAMSILLTVRSNATSSQLRSLVCESPTIRVGNRPIVLHLRIQTF